MSPARGEARACHRFPQRRFYYIGVIVSSGTYFYNSNLPLPLSFGEARIGMTTPVVGVTPATLSYPQFSSSNAYYQRLTTTAP
jgi:hypothetical protein